MSAPVAVLRPEPGNAATARRIEAAGGRAIRLPLFAVRARDWIPPDPSGFTGLLITSANAVRHAGDGLAALRGLPVLAVGPASARAAREAGFRIADTGDAGVDAMLARHRGRTLLHLAGEDRARDTGLTTIVTYASEPVEIDSAPLIDCVALVHSPRAATRLAEVAPDRTRIALAAISPAAAQAAGDGWATVAIAASPDDATLVAAGLALARDAFGR